MAVDRYIGVIGSDGVAQQLALNFSRSGFGVSLFVEEEQDIKDKDAASDLQNRIDSGSILLMKTVKEMARDVESGAKGRRIFLITYTSKEAIEETVDQMSEHLVQGDIILDGDLDKSRELRSRQTQLGERGIMFINMNVPKDYDPKDKDKDNQTSEYNAAEHEAVRYVLEITKICLEINK